MTSDERDLSIERFRVSRAGEVSAKMSLSRGTCSCL